MLCKVTVLYVNMLSYCMVYYVNMLCCVVIALLDFANFENVTVRITCILLLIFEYEYLVKQPIGTYLDHLL